MLKIQYSTFYGCLSLVEETAANKETAVVPLHRLSDESIRTADLNKLAEYKSANTIQTMAVLQRYYQQQTQNLQNMTIQTANKIAKATINELMLWAGDNSQISNWTSIHNAIVERYQEEHADIDVIRIKAEFADGLVDAYKQHVNHNIVVLFPGNDTEMAAILAHDSTIANKMAKCLEKGEDVASIFVADAKKSASINALKDKIKNINKSAVAPVAKVEKVAAPAKIVKTVAKAEKVAKVVALADVAEKVVGEEGDEKEFGVKTTGTYTKSGQQHLEWTLANGVVKRGDMVTFLLKGTTTTGEFRHVNCNVHSPNGYCVIKVEGKIFERVPALVSLVGGSVEAELPFEDAAPDTNVENTALDQDQDEQDANMEANPAAAWVLAVSKSEGEMELTEKCLELGGDANKMFRQDIMFELKKEKLALNKCGVKAIQAAMMAKLGFE